MIIKVIPVKRLPISLPYLDYIASKKLSDKLKIGQLIKIPFRNKEIFGVIYDIDKQGNKKKLKEIVEIIFGQPVLSKQQLAWLQDMSQFYQVSLGWLLKTNLLPLQPKKLAKLEIPKKNLKKIKKQQFTKPKLSIYQTNQEKNQYLIKNLSKSRQNLILLPELASIDNVKLPEELADKVIIITSKLSNKELFECWLQICHGQKNIIIGTRRALFLPWFNLTKIFLVDEANPNYKSWDMAPRFHTREAALFLAKHHQAKLHLLTHTPAVESYYFAYHKVYQQTKQSLLSMANKPSLIDMRDERKKRNFGFLSDKLVEAVKQIKNGDIFFFLNRRGSASYVGCRDCGNVLKCPNCDNLLTWHQDRNDLVCHYCNIRQPMIKTCSNCQGINMVMYGVGTQLAETGIRKLLGSKNTRKVVRIDSDSDVNEFASKKQNSEQDKVIIGTQMAWSFLEWDKIKLLVFLDADTSLFVPEYKVSENLWYLLRDASFRLNNNSRFLLQTSHPQHLVFRYLSQPKKFYEQELSQRQLLGYPPYRFLLKLFYGHAQKITTQAQAEQVKGMLTKLTKTKLSIKLLGPLETVPYFYKGKYWQVILAKVKYNSYKQDIKFLLSKLPIGWRIDPNPNSVLSLR